jgi:hypothetical protein
MVLNVKRGTEAPVPMSQLGQKRCSDNGPTTSGLPRSTDIIRPPQLVRWCHGTKSLRSSPLRGGKNRETGSQLRGQHWRV